MNTTPSSLQQRDSQRTADTRSETRFMFIMFPLGHLANDWPGAALWLLAPAIAISLDLSPVEVGLLLTLHSVGASLAYLPAGILGDRVRNRGLLLTITFWWVAIGYFVAAFFPDFWVLALLLAIAGLGDAAWHPIAAAVMVERAPKKRAQVIGVHALGGTMAEVGAPLCAGFLLSVFDWQTVLQLSVIPAVIMAVLFLKLGARVPHSDRPKVTHQDLLSQLRLWLQPSSLILIAIISFYNMSLMGALAMMPLFVQTVHGYSTAEAGMLFAAVYLLGALAQPLIGQASDIFGRKGVSLAALIIAAVLFLCVVNLESIFWSSVALVISIGLLAGIRSVLLAAMVDRAGGRESTTLGFGFAIMDGVGALGALFAGMSGSVELHHAFLFTAGIATVATVLAAFHGFVSFQACTEK